MVDKLEFFEQHKIRKENYTYFEKKLDLYPCMLYSVVLYMVLNPRPVCAKCKDTTTDYMPDVSFWK